ncbi:serine protease [Blastococcus montanus]|uniref:trypsin-like serine peptidase n=1 Tax=Blastococcus montanus TaxID=3144973 RepID=UPI0032095AEA
MSPFRAGSRRLGPDDAGQEPLWMALDVLAPRTPVPTDEAGAIADARDAGLEAILGSTTDFLPVGFLDLGRRRAEAVARIVVRQPSPDGPLVHGRGTGFLVGPDVLMTNHHVLPDIDKARVSTVEFKYELDMLGNELDADVWELVPDDLFVTSPFEELDTTLVRVATKDGRAAGEVYGQVALRADPRKVAVDEPVCLIQHPDGRRKEVVLFEAKVKELYQEGFLHYSADTLEGSSGSPVFNVTWDLVALHHRGVIERDEAGNYQVKDGQYVYTSNEGVRISAIVDFLRGLPEPQQSAVVPLLVP